MAGITQGEVYWADGDEPWGSEPGFRRPWVVVQNNLANATALNTVLACPITSNLRHARAPGNVTLRRREAGLPTDSVVQVAGLTAVDRSRLDELSGALSARRLGEVLAGVVALLEPRDP